MKHPLEYLKWTGLSAIAGILSGAAASAFLFALDFATRFRLDHREIICFLPIGGFIVGWAYHHFGREVAGGNSLILDEIHDPQKIIPLRMAPLVFLGTVITHLFGGSAGREGTAVQMGATLSVQLANFVKVANDERKILLVAGAGAGFGAAIGAPWAGVIFGMEVIQIGRLRIFAFPECFIASFCAYFLTRILHTPHTIYPSAAIPELAWSAFFWVAIAGIFFGIVAKFFADFTHLIEAAGKRFIRYSPLRPFVAGILLVLLYRWEGSYRYAGLGMEGIQGALQAPSSLPVPAFKLLFSALTVGSGFKGGEFIPLVFIGTTFGSALSLFLPLSFSLLGALGFAAVFGAAANTPIACTIMAAEIFGYRIAPFAAVACYMAYYCSGHSGIYRSQKIYRKKHKRIMEILGWLGELPRRFFNGNSSHS